MLLKNVLWMLNLTKSSTLSTITKIVDKIINGRGGYLTQLVEYFAYNEKVGGSSPLLPKLFLGEASLFFFLICFLENS